MVRTRHGKVPMDTKKFDGLSKALGTATSRRSLALGAVGGTAAALFAAIGLRTAQAGEVDAERRRRRRRKPQPVTPAPIVTCVTQVGVALNPTGQANGTACTGGSAAACQSGHCTSTICQPCPTVCELLNGGQVCCPGSTTCIDGACKTCKSTPAPVTPPRRRRRRRQHN